MSFSFMNPAAFFLLLLIPLFLVFRKVGLLQQISFPLTFADWGGYVFSWDNKLLNFTSALSTSLVFAAFVMIVFAFADPVISEQERVYTTRGSDIIFVLDTSPSMAARDIGGGTRIDAAKQAAHSLVQKNSGASYGLVAMGNEAAIVVPPTSDLDYFESRLSSLTLGEMGEGTAIGTGLSSAIYHLSTSMAPRKSIVLITDGENNAGEIHPDTAAKLAVENKITLYTVGIGTRGSVPLDYKDPYTGKEYTGYLDSSFDSGPLEKIALSSGGHYYGVENLPALSTALSAITRRESVAQNYYLRNVNKQYYDKFLFAAILIFALSWTIRRFLLKEFV